MGRKRVKELLLVGQKKVPHGFGFRSGDAGNTADGAGNQTSGGQPAELRLLGRTGDFLSHGLLFLFLRYGTLDWAKGGRKDSMCLWVF